MVARAAAHNAHYPNWNLRTVFRVRADNGLTGYGDYRCPPPDATVAGPLIGRSPFEFLGNDLNPGLGAALYDLMGKQLDVQPKGWRAAAGPFGKKGSRYSVADITDEASLAQVRAFKKERKAAAKAAG